MAFASSHHVCTLKLKQGLCKRKVNALSTVHATQLNCPAGLQEQHRVTAPLHKADLATYKEGYTWPQLMSWAEDCRLQGYTDQQVC